jgi:sirohydrochlorin ferrochelatase
VTSAILLVDHGSRRPEANRVVEAVAAAVQGRSPDRVVRVAHLELAEPDVGAGIDACVAAGADRIDVHPYFLGPGNHTSRDIPRLVGEAARRHPGVRVRISAPLGFHEKLADLVLERIAQLDEAPERRPPG